MFENKKQLADYFEEKSIGINKILTGQLSQYYSKPEDAKKTVAKYIKSQCLNYMFFENKKWGLQIIKSFDKRK